jgi:vancomycin resistance protein VanJ
VERIALIAASLAVVAAGACDRRAPPEPELARAPGLRVLTYNVYFGNQDMAATAAVIREAGADVVALQETTPAIADALRRALADLYPHMEFHVGPLGNGPGVLARTVPRDARYVPSAAGMNGFWIGTFTVGGRDLQVANVHLHPSEFVGWNPLRATAAYDRAEQVRGAQVDELRARLTPDVPTVLLGDLNSLPRSPTLTRLADLGWTASAADDDAPTYEIRGIGFRIDHVLVPPAIECANPLVRRAGPSDHFPLAATLSWR